jgi:DNA-binding NtrC family response regulator
MKPRDEPDPGSDPDAQNPFRETETTEQAAAGREASPSSAFRLVVAGPPGRAQQIQIDATSPAPLLVGSSPVCALRLDDPTVSRRHVALELARGGLRLRDLDSTNGTRVDGVRVVEVVLEGGERIEIGTSAIRVERERGGGRASELSTDTSFGQLIGASVEMRRLYPLLRRLAQSTIPVVIEGETGTGKEALAEALHDASPRAGGPFVVFDCTAVAPNLIESELFGHDKGAFTGAVSSRLGLFQQAHGGTLLIDEIGDLDLAMQPKLLRAIERSEVRPLGAAHSVRVDVRLIAATRRDLDREVQEGRFRDDLFHRLAVARVELPPLRRRQGDAGVLARHYWSTLAREGGAGPSGGAEPPPELLRRWERESWPGNVRQLRNAVARALALGELEPDEPARPAAAPGQDVIDEIIRQRLPLPVARERVVHELERRYLEEALARHGGNVTRAARESGIALRYFQLLRRRRGS